MCVCVGVSNKYVYTRENSVAPSIFGAFIVSIN